MSLMWVWRFFRFISWFVIRCERDFIVVFLMFLWIINNEGNNSNLNRYFIEVLLIIELK